MIRRVIRNVSTFLARLFIRKKANESSWGIGAYDGFSLLATPAGFFVLDRNEMSAARAAALSRDEAREHARPQIVSFSRKSKFDSAKVHHRQRLSEKICVWYAAQFETKMRAFYTQQGEQPRERRLFAGSCLRLGKRIVVGAIDWNWSRFGTLLVEEIAGPVAGTLIRLEGHQETIFLPFDDLQTVTMWPTKAVFRYPARSIILDLYEPEWQTLGRSRVLP